MLCYRDMTFCNFYKDCKEGNTCNKALTDKVKLEAEQWWRSFSPPPIATYIDKPDCFIKGE